MIIQLNYYTRQFTGNILDELPSHFYFSPKDKTELTEDNASQFGYLTAEEYFKAAVNQHLEDTAHSFGYEDMKSARSYAGEDNPFQAQSKQFIRWSAGVWGYCFVEIGKLNAGEREFITAEDFINELPKFEDFESNE